MSNDIEHLLMYLLAVYISLLVKYIFKSFVHFLIGWFVLLSCKHSLYILNIYPLSDKNICKYLLLVCGLFFELKKAP